MERKLSLIFQLNARQRIRRKNRDEARSVTEATPCSAIRKQTDRPTQKSSALIFRLITACTTTGADSVIAADGTAQCVQCTPSRSARKGPVKSARVTGTSDNCEFAI